MDLRHIVELSYRVYRKTNEPEAYKLHRELLSLAETLRGNIKKQNLDVVSKTLVDFINYL